MVDKIKDYSASKLSKGKKQTTVKLVLAAIIYVVETESASEMIIIALIWVGALRQELVSPKFIWMISLQSIKDQLISLGLKVSNKFIHCQNFYLEEAANRNLRLIPSTAKNSIFLNRKAKLLNKISEKS